MDDWYRMLARARSRLGVSQADLAARSHVSHASVKAYEEGKRHPSRLYLTAMLDALKIDRVERNLIMAGAGYASDGMSFRPTHDDLTFTVDEAALEIERYHWPAFIVDEMMGVPCANRMAQRLWGVDLDREFLDPIGRNLLSVASNPRFAERCVNLDEILAILVSVWKGHHRGPESVDNPSPFFGAMLERFAERRSRRDRPVRPRLADGAGAARQAALGLPRRLGRAGHRRRCDSTPSQAPPANPTACRSTTGSPSTPPLGVRSDCGNSASQRRSHLCQTRARHFAPI